MPAITQYRNRPQNIKLAAGIGPRSPRAPVGRRGKRERVERGRMETVSHRKVYCRTNIVTNCNRLTRKLWNFTRQLNEW
eukprot:442457-Rhodomonas_salina.2